MKRFIVGVLTAALVLGLAACGRTTLPEYEDSVVTGTVQKEEEMDVQDEPEDPAEAQLPMTEAALKLGLEE